LNEDILRNPFRWEGAVLEMFDGGFLAEVVDGSGERSVAEFDMQDVDLADIELCVPGGLFFWLVGDGSVRIIFRRQGEGE